MKISFSINYFRFCVQFSYYGTILAGSTLIARTGSASIVGGLYHNLISVIYNSNDIAHDLYIKCVLLIRIMKTSMTVFG